MVNRIKVIAGNILMSEFTNFLFTDQQLADGSNYTKFNLRCTKCNKVFAKNKKTICGLLSNLSYDFGNRTQSVHTQSYKRLTLCTDCFNDSAVQTLTCARCGKQFKRKVANTKQTKSNLHFCSTKCSRCYYVENDIRRKWSTFEHTNPNRNLLFTIEQYHQLCKPSTVYDKQLDVRCVHCNNVFKVSVAQVDDFYLSNANGKTKQYNLRFCSVNCFHDWLRNPKRDQCYWCGTKLTSDADNTFNFCSTYCHDRYYNRPSLNIDAGRSNVEKYVERFLKYHYSNLKVNYNDRSRLIRNLELDIFIESIQCAIEINGAMHYPDSGYGKTHLNEVNKTAAKDQLKVELCKQRNIDLLVINTSKINGLYLPQINQIVIKPIVEFIDSHLKIETDWDVVNLNLNALVNLCSDLINCTRHIPTPLPRI